MSQLLVGMLDPFMCLYKISTVLFMQCIRGTESVVLGVIAFKKQIENAKVKHAHTMLETQYNS